MRFFNKSTAYNSTVLQHIFKVYKIAVVHVLSKIIRVVEVNYTLLVRLNNIRRQKYTLGYILAYLACHIVALNAVYGGIFIGIFLLYFLVVTFDKT